MKPGFTLIELLIAMVVSSMLALVLYGALWQISRQSGWFNDRVSVGMRSAIALHQLERDISGAFVPLSELSEVPSADKKKSPSAKASDSAKASTDRSEDRGKDEREPLKQIFYSENKNDHLSMLTCVTSNPLPDPKSKTPRIVRVMYRVEPEDKSKKSFKLVRQEAVDLDPKAIKKIPQDTLITGIQTITVSYLVVDKQDGEIEQKTFKEWLGKDEVQQEKILPHSAIITLTLWARDKKRTKEFKTTVLMPGHAFVYQEKEPAKAAEQKKPAFAGMSKADLQKMKKMLQTAKATP